LLAPDDGDRELISFGVGVIGEDAGGGHGEARVLGGRECVVDGDGRGVAGVDHDRVTRGLGIAGKRLTRIDRDRRRVRLELSNRLVVVG